MQIFYLVILLLILYIIHNNFYEKFTNFNQLLKPSYLPNVNVINQKINIPTFNIENQCNDKSMKKYLGLKCFYNKIQKSNIKDNTNWKGTVFYNYLKNTPLKYDGLWSTKCNNNNCLWQLF